MIKGGKEVEARYAGVGFLKPVVSVYAIHPTAIGHGFHVGVWLRFKLGIVDGTLVIDAALPAAQMCRAALAAIRDSIAAAANAAKA